MKLLTVNLDTLFDDVEEDTLPLNYFFDKIRVLSDKYEDITVRVDHDDIIFYGEPKKVLLYRIDWDTIYDRDQLAISHLDFIDSLIAASKKYNISTEQEGSAFCIRGEEK